MTGFHLSLLVVLFLQTSDPPILPKLQVSDHQPRNIASFDVWFDSNSEFRSSNVFSIGELFQLFLTFLLDLFTHGYTGNMKLGCLIENDSCEYLFSLSSPFTSIELSNVLKSSNEAKRCMQVVSESLSFINCCEKLNKIMNYS